ncbi:C2H2 type zinc-finger-domain-containing protein [Xylariaceae sp. FL0255]|nr:C2H2 type zinc-finger-domain-containing protein [Xylariaceae sp. FL0255]
MSTIISSRPSVAQPDATTSSHQFTCNTCQVAFRYADTQKGHMKSDWHRYNLKRRVTSLPPISSEVFTEKVLQARAATTAEADKAGFQQLCEVCQKTYYSENSYQNHINSQKHKAREAAIARRGGQPDDTSSVMSSNMSLGDLISAPSEHIDSDADEEFNEVVEGLQKTDLKDRPSPVKRPTNPTPSSAMQEHVAPGTASEGVSSTGTPVPSITLKSCLFCNYDSPTLDLNVLHMERIHGMFIPEKKYLVDLEGLMKSLQQRIQKFGECLYCGKYKNTALAVQTHMRDKGHCMIPFTSEEEQLQIGDFYDFRSTYSDGEEDSDDESVDDKPNGGAKLGAKRSSKSTGADGEDITEEEEGWETDSSASSCASEDLQSIPVDHHYKQIERLDKNPHHSSHDPRHHHQKDGWHSHAHKHRAIFYDDTEMHLPSGRSVGHRQYAKYYRQNLHNYLTAEERAEQLAIEGADTNSSSGDDAAAIGENGDRRIVGRRGQQQNNALAKVRGLEGVTLQKRAEMSRAEVRDQKEQQRAQRHATRGDHKRMNNLKYYRPELLQ